MAEEAPDWAKTEDVPDWAKSEESKATSGFDLGAASRASGLPETTLGGVYTPIKSMIGAARLAYEHYKGEPGPATEAYNKAREEFAKTSPEDMTWGSVPERALSNLPSSTENLAVNTVEPFLHPLQTAENIKNVGQGALEKAGIVSTTGHEQYADAVGKFFADRYGGMDNFKKTLATDPLGVAADLSTVMSGGELAVARVPGMIGEAGRAVGTVGRAVDPIQGAITALKGVGEAAAPGLSDARALEAAGLPMREMTPGQIVGGIGKNVEDTATSVPVLGSFVSAARKRSIEAFNKAAANQALDEIGESLNPATRAGHAAIDEVATKLGDAYERLKPKINWLPDKQFANDLTQIYNNKISLLPKQQARQFDNIMQSRVGVLPQIKTLKQKGVLPKPSTPISQRLQYAPLNGEQFKQLESELSGMSRNYSSSSDAAQRDLGYALNGVVKAMRSNLERSNPALRAELGNINSGWAMYSLLRDAAAARKTSEGVFMPSDLLGAIKGGDKSVRKGAFARGNALMQAYAEAGQKVLPSTLPSSGTAERAALMGAAAGSAWWLHRPEIMTAVAASTLPYTKSGRAILARMAAGSGSTTAHGAAFQAGRLNEMQQPPFARGGRVHKKQKLTHASVHYVETFFNRKKSCDKCSMYREDGPSCDLVQSPIHPTGHCNRFDPK